VRAAGPDQTAVAPARRRRWAFPLLAAAILCAATLGPLLRSLAARAAPRVLGEIFAPRPGFQAIHFDVPRGRLRLSPLTLHARDTDRLLARVEDLLVDLGMGLGGPRIERVHLNHPEIFGWARLLRARASSGEVLPMLSVQDGTIHFPIGPGEELLLDLIRFDLRRAPLGGICGPGSLSFPGGNLRFEATLHPQEVSLSGSAVFKEAPGTPFSRFDPLEDLRVDATVHEDASLDLRFAGPRFSAKIPETSVRIEDPRGTARFSEAERGVELRARVAGGTVRVAGPLWRRESASTELEVRADDVTLGAELSSLGALDPIVHEIFEGLRPEGRADFHGRLLLVQGHPRGLDGEGELRDLGIRVEGFADSRSEVRIGFPLPARVRRGSVTVRPERIWIHGVEGEMGGGDLAFSGEVFSFPNVGLDLEARVRGMRIGPEVRDALGRVPGAQEAFDAVDPRGAADVAVRIARPPGQDPVHVAVRIEPKGGSVRWEGFPVRIEELEGSVEIDPEILAFELRGRACGGEVHLRGTWSGPRGEGDPLPGIDLEVRAREMEPTEEFLRAVETFAPSAGTFLLAANPAGRFDLEIRGFRPAGALEPEPSLSIRAHLRGLSCRIPPTSFPATEVRGDVRISRREGRTAVDAEGIRGSVGSGGGAPAFLALEHRDGPEGASTAVQVQALSIPLDESFVEALRASGIPGLPREFFLGGALDVELLSRRGLGPNEDRATVRLRSVDARSSEPRLAFEDLEGELEAGPEGLRAQRLTARWAGAPVALEEVEVVPGERTTTISFLLHAEGVPLREEARSDLPAPAAEVLRALALRGEVDLAPTRVVLELPEDSPAAISIRGDLRLRSLSVGTGSSLEDLQGEARIESLQIDASGVSGRGTVEAASGRILGRAIDALSAEFELAGSEVRIPRLSALLAGGSWREGEDDALRLELEPPSRLHVSLALEDVDLARLLARAIPRSGDLAGKVSGGVSLSATLGEPESVTGDGAVSIVDGALGAIPVFRNLYAFLQIGSKPVFRTGYAHFTLGERRLRFDDVELSSPLMEIRARGTLGFDGELNLRLDSSLFPFLPDLLLVTDLWRLFKRQFVSFRLYGPVENPKVRMENLLLGVLGSPERVKRFPYLPPAAPRRSSRPPWF
jgi:hypothetical protein